MSAAGGLTGAVDFGAARFRRSAVARCRRAGRRSPRRDPSAISLHSSGLTGSADRRGSMSRRRIGSRACSPEFQLVVADRGDRRIRRICRPWRCRHGLPLNRCRLLLHVEQDRHRQRRPALLRRRPDCSCRGRRESSPTPPRPTCCHCIRRRGCWRRHRRRASRRSDRRPRADARPVARKTAENATIRMIFPGQCNMVQTCNSIDHSSGVKTPQWAFPVDETAFKRTM